MALCMLQVFFIFQYCALLSLSRMVPRSHLPCRRSCHRGTCAPLSNTYRCALLLLLLQQPQFAKTWRGDTGHALNRASGVGAVAQQRLWPRSLGRRRLIQQQEGIQSTTTACYVHDTSELIQALSNPALHTIFIAVPHMKVGSGSAEITNMNSNTSTSLSTSLGLSTSGSTEKPSTISVGRNITLAGDPQQPEWPVVDLTGVKGLMRLLGGVTMIIQHLVLENARSDIIRVPGMDFLAPTPEGKKSLVIFNQAAVIVDVCFPGWVFKADLTSIHRPEGFSGHQQLAVDVNQDGCIANASVHPMHRCWSSRVYSIDVVGDGVDASVEGYPVATRITFFLNHSTGLCSVTVDEDCLQDRHQEPMICYLQTVKKGTVSTAAVQDSLPNTASSSSSSSLSDTKNKSATLNNLTSLAGRGQESETPSGAANRARLIIILSSTAIGLPIILLAAVAVFIVMLRHRRRQQLLTKLNSSDADAMIISAPNGLSDSTTAAAATDEDEVMSNNNETGDFVSCFKTWLSPLYRMASHKLATATHPSSGLSKRCMGTRAMVAAAAAITPRSVTSVIASGKSSGGGDNGDPDDDRDRRSTCRAGKVMFTPAAAAAAATTTTEGTSSRRLPTKLKQKHLAAAVAAAPTSASTSLDRLGLSTRMDAAVCDAPVTPFTIPHHNIDLHVRVLPYRRSDATVLLVAPSMVVDPNNNNSDNNGCATDRLMNTAVVVQLPSSHPSSPSGYDDVIKEQPILTEEGPIAAVESEGEVAVAEAAPKAVAAVTKATGDDQQQGSPAIIINRAATEQCQQLIIGNRNTVNDSVRSRRSTDGDGDGDGDDDEGDGSRGSRGTSSSTSGGATGCSAGVVRLLPTVLGKGGFGRVVEGTYGSRRVAVKMLGHGMPWIGGGGQESAFARSFEQEVQILSRCHHPNIVRLLAACVTPPHLCLVMELMETSLDRLMYGDPSQPVMPLPKVLHIGIAVASALTYLHPTIVHRDLKPGNVLVNNPASDKPLVKLSDFGLSRLRLSTIPTKSPDAGTPAYMAPECFDVCTSSITHRVDMYSLGVVLWEMLAGSRPWVGLTPVAIGFMVTYRDARLPLTSLVDNYRCPPRLARLLVDCWQVDPERRPAAQEVAKKLTLILQEYQQEQHNTSGSTSSSGMEQQIVSRDSRQL